MRVSLQTKLRYRLESQVPDGSRYDWLREMSVEECLQKLRELTGQDFGNDVNAWIEWLKANRPSFETE